MIWNYRIVRYRNGSGFGLHEVIYDDEGQPETMTADPAGFVADLDEGPDSIAEQSEAAMEDATKLPVLDEISLTTAN